MKIYGEKGHDDLKKANGHDPGAVSGGLVESAINVVVAEAFRDRILDYNGMDMLLEDANQSINECARAANAYGADIVLSFHENAGGGKRGEVIYGFEPGSKELAEVLAQGMKNAGQPIVKIYQSPPNSAGNAEYFGILRLTRMKGAIIECAFLDNPEDRQKIDTVAEQQHFGICMADAVAQAYGGTLKDDAGFSSAIAKLVARKVVGTPGYWLDSVHKGTPVSGEWMGLLIKGMTGKASVAEGIDALVSAGVISSPGYWVGNCVPGKTVDPRYVAILVTKGVAKLGL